VSARKRRLWRYEVTAVWGDNPTVAVGQIVVDCWKGRRGSWDVFDMTTGTMTWGWSGVLLGEHQVTP
jgi:hypothetical protein